MTARSLALLALLAALAGCASVNQPDPAVLADEAANEAAMGNPAYTATEPSVDLDGVVDAPVSTAAPLATSTAAPAAVEQDPAPTSEPVYALPPERSLAIAKVTLKTTGLWLWKRCAARIEVRNSTPRVLDGEVLVTFTYDGAAVETKRELVDALEPGASWSFDATSTKRADDATVEVETRLP